MFQTMLKTIRKYDTIIIHRHTRPDGDALGSQIGLKHLIRENFPEKIVYTVGDGAGYLSFMEGSVMDSIPDSAYSGALAVLLDSSSPLLISDERWKTAAATARFTTCQQQQTRGSQQADDSLFHIDPSELILPHPPPIGKVYLRRRANDPPAEEMDISFLKKYAPTELPSGRILWDQIKNYSWGPAATRALPSSLPVYLVKFLMKRADRSFAFSSQTEASA